MGWIGGGDAKRASAAALWLGLPHVLGYLIYLVFGVLSRAIAAV